MGFVARVVFDYTQTVEEQYAVRVFNVRSIDAVGYRRGTLSGALQGEYADLVATESAIKLYRTAVVSTPPANLAHATDDTTASTSATLSAETDRDAANAALEALIAMAKVDIRESHRKSRVSCDVPLLPFLDLDKTIRIEADGVTAQGKVVAVRHVFDPDAGTAVSSVSLAVSSVAGAGIVHDDDSGTVDDEDEDESTPLSGAPVVAYDPAVGSDHVITVTFPGVADSARLNAEIPIAREIAAAIPEDVFTLTIED